MTASDLFPQHCLLSLAKAADHFIAHLNGVCREAQRPQAAAL